MNCFIPEQKFPESPCAGVWPLHTAKAGENLLALIGYERISRFALYADRQVTLIINGRNKIAADDNFEKADGLYVFRHAAMVQDLSGNKRGNIFSLAFDREAQFHMKYYVNA